MLRINKLVKSFGGVLATDNLTFKVERGELHAVIGPNGAGKSTLFNAMSGLVPIKQGSIVFEGVDVTHLPVHLRAPRG